MRLKLPVATSIVLLHATSACVITTSKSSKVSNAAANQPEKRIDYAAQNKALAEQFQAELVAAGDDVHRLHEVRAHVLAHAPDESYPRTDGYAAHERNEARRDALWTVLRPLQLKLVDVYLASGHPTEALREMMATGDGERSSLAGCKFEDEACRARLKRIDAAFPGFCLGFEGQSCGLIGNEGFLIAAINDRRKIGRTVETTVTNIKKAGTDLIITTMKMGPNDWKDCQGRYETDKIKEVKSDSIIVERTTWCQKITQRHDNGYSIQFRVPAPDREIPVGAQVRVYFNQQDQKTAGTVTTFSNARILASRSSLSGQTVYVGNEELNWEQASRMGLSSSNFDVR